MRSNKFYAGLGFAVLYSLQVSAALELAPKRKPTPCLEMELNWGGKKPKFKSKEIGPDTVFTFPTYGKLKSSAEVILKEWPMRP